MRRFSHFSLALLGTGAIWMALQLGCDSSNQVPVVIPPMKTGLASPFELHLKDAFVIEDKSIRFEWIYPVPSEFPLAEGVSWRAIGGDGRSVIGVSHGNASFGSIGPGSLWGASQTVGQQGVLLVTDEIWAYISESQQTFVRPLTSEVHEVFNLGESLFAIHTSRRSDKKVPSGGPAREMTPVCRDFVYDPFDLWKAPADVVPRDFMFQDRIVISKNGKFGFANRKGEIVVEPVYDYARHFSDGMAAVLVDEEWGYIDLDGVMKIEPQFLRASPFDNGVALALVDLNGKRVLINVDGDVLERPDNNTAGLLSEGLAPKGNDGKYGFVDARGEWIIEPAYRFLSPFEHNSAFVVHANAAKSGVIDRTGRLQIELPKLAKASRFRGDLAWVEIENGPTGYINTLGEWVWKVESAQTPK